MKLPKIKNTIEEKSIALEKLIEKLDREKGKRFFKSKNRINDLEKQISSLDEEITKLETLYNKKLDLEEGAGKIKKRVLPLIRKHALKGCAGLAVLTAGGYMYLANKPLYFEGDQTTYRSMVDSYENMQISSDEYTPETYQKYISILDEASADENDIFMSDAEKLKNLEALSSAYDALEVMPDKTGLRNLLSESDRYDVSAFTPKSVEEYTAALADARSVFDDVNATEKEVSAAETSVNDAYSLLVEAADKNELTELYEKYSDYNFDGYTPASVKRFQNEVENTKRFLDDKNISQAKVDDQVNAMLSIEDLLVEKADKDSLQSITDEYSGLDEADYKEGYPELQKTLSAAEKILKDENASQEDVDAAVLAVEESKNNLVEYTVNVYRVNIRARMENNNSVGNDWSYDRYYNNESVHDGFEVTGEPGSSVNVGMEITENDKSPDIGYGYADIILEDGYTDSFDIIVTEDRGRDSGRTATFSVDVSVTYLRSE